MLHTASLIAGLIALICAVALYGMNIRTRPTSRLRSDFWGSMFLALLTGLFPLAAAGSLVGMWRLLQGGVTVEELLAGGADVVSLAAVVATVLVLRALVVATYRPSALPDNVTPLTPRPLAPRRAATRLKKRAA